MAGFWKMFKRLNTNQWGIVTGSDFRNGNLPSAYIGKADDGSANKLMIYGEKIEDYIFDKSNVVSVQILQQEARFTMGNQPKIGPKYQVKFTDGKTALIAVPAQVAYRIEQVIM